MARVNYDFDALLKRLEPSVRRAFEEAIADITSEAQIALIAGHLADGNVEAAVLALNIRPEFLAPLDNALAGLYLEAGRQATLGLPALPDPFPAGAWRRGLMAAILARGNGSGGNRQD